MIKLIKFLKKIYWIFKYYIMKKNTYKIGLDIYILFII